MRSKVQILDGQVRIQMGDLRLAFPDEPVWWLVAERTAEAIAELGSGVPDEGRG